MGGQAAVQHAGRHEARPLEEQVTAPRGRAVPSQAGAPHASRQQGMFVPPPYVDIIFTAALRVPTYDRSSSLRSCG